MQTREYQVYKKYPGRDVFETTGFLNCFFNCFFLIKMKQLNVANPSLILGEN